MNAAEIQALVDASVARALAAKDQEIANAIAEGLRTYADRPVGEKGAPSLQFGVVEQVNDTYAYVTLDGQTDAVPINMLGGLVEGERVAVMLFPPSGNLAIGMVTPSVVPPVTPGGTAAGVSGLYATSPGTVSIPTGAVNTDLSWGTLTFGTALLDLTVPTKPTVLTDGIYTFDANVQSGTPGTDFEIAIKVVDGSYQGFGGNGSVNKFLGTSCTSFLHAGSSVEVEMQQNSGGAVNALLTFVTVTRIT